MNVRRLWTVLILLACGAVHAQVVSIADFPRSPVELTAQQQQDIRRVARAATAVLITGAQVDVAVYGYADYDQGGRDQELRFSTERARAAEAVLRGMLADEIGRASLPPERIEGATSSSMGLGTLRPMFARPANEQEGRANRRVEFALRVNAAPPGPPAGPVLGRCLQVISTVSEPGPRWRMNCVCHKLLQEGPYVGDNYYDYRAKSQLPGSAVWPGLTSQQWTVDLGNFVRHLRQDIVTAAQGVLNQDFARRLVVLDDAVGRDIDNFHSQPVSESASGLLDRAFDYDIQSRMADPNHTYSCYAGYSRARHDQ
ncbi:MAG TPA: hypothetical protein VF861_13365 [Telluria sp.]